MLGNNIITSKKVKMKVGDSMNNEQTILQMAKENNGVVTTAQVVEAGILRGSLKHLVDIGLLEKSSRGVYTLPEAWDDEFLNTQVRYKKGIYALETALFLLELTDRTPDKFRMTFPATYNLSNAKGNGIICTRSKEAIYSLGVIDVRTPAGHRVKCYNTEKTLCDILVARNRVNIEIISTAFKMYAKQKDKDLDRLSAYAKLLKVENRVRAYMEVLL